MQIISWLRFYFINKCPENKRDVYPSSFIENACRAILLSVIILAYNLEKYIGVCFDSLLPQLDKRAEVIVIDDGFTDHTYEICKNYEAKYPIFVLLPQI